MKNLKLILLAAVTSLVFFSCSEDDDSNDSADVEVTVNGEVLFDNNNDFGGDIDGDFTGTNGTVTRTFVWNNGKTTADYNADITSTSEGVFIMTVVDASGNVVLMNTLNGGQEPDSFSGVTDAGTAGIWSVTIQLTSFTGDGSFSLSEGD